MPVETQYVSTADAAKLSGMGYDWVIKQIREGKLAAKKFGQRVWLVDRGSLDALLKHKTDAEVLAKAETNDELVSILRANDYVPVSIACKVLKLTRARVHILIRDKRIASKKTGRKVYVTTASLVSFMNGRT